VVPSLESALYADYRLIQWNLKEGLNRAEAVAEAEKRGCSAVRQGIVEIEGVPTKHYLREELIAQFEQMGLDILSIEKVEYSWETEFDGPPRWMAEPYPWDWLVVLSNC